MKKEQKLTFQNVRIILQNCSALDGDEDSRTWGKTFRSISLSRQLHITEKHAREIRVMIRELIPSALKGDPIPFRWIKRHNTGNPWCEDDKSADILLLLAIAIGAAEIVGPRSVWHNGPDDLPYVRIWSEK